MSPMCGVPSNIIVALVVMFFVFMSLSWLLIDIKKGGKHKLRFVQFIGGLIGFLIGFMQFRRCSNMSLIVVWLILTVVAFFCMLYAMTVMFLGRTN